MPTSARTTWPHTIRTSRLTLRPMGEADRSTLIRLVTDPAARDYLGGAVAFASTQALELSPLGLTWGQWAIAEPLSDEMLGSITLSDDREALQLAFALLPERQGRGYAVEAAAGLLLWIARHRLADEVIAITPSRNKRSVRLLQRLGFATVRGFEEFGAPHLLMSCRPDADDILERVPGALSDPHLDPASISKEPA